MLCREGRLPTSEFQGLKNWEVVRRVFKSKCISSIVVNGIGDLFSIVTHMYKDAVMINNVENNFKPFPQSWSSLISLQHYISLNVLPLDIFNPLVPMLDVTLPHPPLILHCLRDSVHSFLIFFLFIWCNRKVTIVQRTFPFPELLENKLPTQCLTF